MDSSDDSFAWTDASTSNSTSDDGYEKTEMSKTESKENLKKKLHKNLFKEESEAKVKQELLNGDVKRELGSSQDEASGHLPPAPPAARKRKRERSVKPTSTSDSEADLHLLEKHVKRERFASQTPHNEYNDHKNYNNDSGQDIQESLNASKSTNKRKKSIRQSRDESVENDYIDTVIKDKFEEEKSFIQSRPAENGLDDTHNHKYVSDSETVHKSKKSKKKKHREHSSNVEAVDTEQIENNHSSSSHQTPECRQDIHSSDETNNLALHQTATKISDRIQFEDEEHTDKTSRSASSDTHSAKLWRFLKANPQLQLVTEKPPSLSQDEDIWLLNCPQEIDISTLQGVDISLDSKCKLKSNSQTYIGSIQNENSHIPIYIHEHKPVVKNVLLHGIVNFRKRIPKAHYVDDNVVQNEPDFIPLPETKHRHPLFGTDYKKAIKIPSVIKARLSHSNVTSYSDMSAPPESKSKKKKKHKIKVKEESEEDSSFRERGVVHGEGESGGEGKGERKRRRQEHEDTDSQPARKKKKKGIKQEVSIGSWDSEKAIEDNLFNC